MDSTETDFFAAERRQKVRLGTLVLLRWAAIVGQLAAIYVAARVFHLRIPFGPVAIAIGASVIANLVFSAIGQRSLRLTGREAAPMLAFDILQLGALLSLTGGLNNPFALLLLVPVTISATMLRRHSTMLLWLLSFAVMTLLVWWNLPLISAAGEVLLMPPLLKFGLWSALVVGTTFLSIYAHRVTAEMADLAEALTATQLALERTQKLTDLDGVVAAAAHELGTPLAIIKLTAAELLDELDAQPELAEDARLISQSADRCRDILRSMGRAGKADMQLRSAPLEELVREAAEPHMARGKEVAILLPEGDRRGQPLVWRRPEVIHGLRNLIQNAVDFAATRVEVRPSWSDKRLVLRISDDGPGFPAGLIGRIGEPMTRRRRAPDEAAREAGRPHGYEGMGLGLFIAKTLLERSGARLSFANGSSVANGSAGAAGRRGAIVVVDWPREVIEAPAGMALGDNALLQP